MGRRGWGRGANTGRSIQIWSGHVIKNVKIMKMNAYLISWGHKQETDSFTLIKSVEARRSF